jgi:hypothetical protein
MNSLTGMGVSCDDCNPESCNDNTPKMAGLDKRSIGEMGLTLVIVVTVYLKGNLDGAVFISRSEALSRIERSRESGARS